MTANVASGREERAPRAAGVSPRAAALWVRRNLCATWSDAVLTLLILAGLALLVPKVWAWAVTDAAFAGSGRDACAAVDGACWVFVRVRFMQFIYGFYPEAERWRVNGAVVTLAVWAGLLFWRGLPARRWVAAGLVVIYPLLAAALLLGGMMGLEPVETAKWGGLMLTLVIAITGIAGSLPIGILLALGRRSRMPVISRLCVAFIELWRGVPLITVLFMASVMLPIFLPAGVTFDKLARALVGVTLFSGAYMAEVVRGGLQALPKGQYEAAEALGLGYWRMMGLVILPQALRKVIPGIVNTFIGLFKDTTLVLIIGMFDLLGIVQTAATDAEWLGYSLEGYVFAGLLFWVFCFGMSRYSARLETRLAAGSRGGDGGR